MSTFLPYLIASVVAACVWTILEFSLGQRKRSWIGLLGAWTASVILAALWKSEVLPLVADLIQLVLLLWLGSILALVVAVVLASVSKELGRRWILCCAVFCLFVHIAAVLHFFWIAAVSPGGV